MTITVESAIQMRWSIIPVRLDKRPFFRLLPWDRERQKHTWKPFQQRQATIEELTRWRAAKPAAYGLVTGEFSGRVTFDFDGEDGKKLADAWGIQPHRRTGSGGLHWDVQWPGFLVPTLNGKTLVELGEKWPGLDIKGDGGYCVIVGVNEKGPGERVGYRAWRRASALPSEGPSGLPESQRVVFVRPCGPRASEDFDYIYSQCPSPRRLGGKRPRRMLNSTRDQKRSPIDITAGVARFRSDWRNHLRLDTVQRSRNFRIGQHRRHWNRLGNTYRLTSCWVA